MDCVPIWPVTIFVAMRPLWMGHATQDNVIDDYAIVTFAYNISYIYISIELNGIPRTNLRFLDKQWKNGRISEYRKMVLLFFFFFLYINVT